MIKLEGSAKLSERILVFIEELFALLSFFSSFLFSLVFSSNTKSLLHTVFSSSWHVQGVALALESGQPLKCLIVGARLSIWAAASYISGQRCSGRFAPIFTAKSKYFSYSFSIAVLCLCVWCWDFKYKAILHREVDEVDTFETCLAVEVYDLNCAFELPLNSSDVALDDKWNVVLCLTAYTWWIRVASS